MESKNLAAQNGLCLGRALLEPVMACPSLVKPWSADRGILCCGEGRLRLGGLFEVFFESYWTRFTSLRQVEWRCRLKGRARFILWRRDVTNGVETKLAEWFGEDCIEEKTVILRTDLKITGESSLQIEIEANQSTIVSDMGCYAPYTAPNPVQIGLVVTTYEREAFVRANLARLAEQLDGAKLLIVNHGAPGLKERLIDAVPVGMQVQFIDQENSGGSGGFTRGMREHRRDGEVSHICLMDDDIDLSGDLVQRVRGIFAWANQSFCVGGAMFDYHARTKLFSAGDFLVPGSFGIGHVSPEGGGDVALAQDVDFLARQHSPDFNGWWCFAFPADAIDEIGLPIPCFIRGDDVEYGYRLKKSGRATIPWPGIAVWHMPFADKSMPWHMFYDRRNSLFINAIHNRVDWMTALRKMIGGFIHHLLRYDYDRVRAMTLGITAFNKGWAAMAAWNFEDHRKLVNITSRHDLHVSARSDGTMSSQDVQRLTGRQRSSALLKRLLIDLFLPQKQDSAISLPPGIVWRPDYLRRPNWVVEVAVGRSPERVFRHSRLQSWIALWRCFRALAGMMWHFRQKVDLPRIDAP
jgi:GT2 family glycosyltransferase